MKTYDDYIRETGEQREALFDKVEKISSADNGKKISVKEIPQYSIRLAVEISTEVIHSELRMYHEWLTSQFDKQPS